MPAMPNLLTSLTVICHTHSKPAAFCIKCVAAMELIVTIPKGLSVTFAAIT